MQEKFIFYYVTVSLIYTTTGGAEQIRGCVAVIINPLTLPISDNARNDAHIASTGVRLY